MSNIGDNEAISNFVDGEATGVFNRQTASTSSTTQRRITQTGEPRERTVVTTERRTDSSNSQANSMVQTRTGFAGLSPTKWMSSLTASGTVDTLGQATGNAAKAHVYMQRFIGEKTSKNEGFVNTGDRMADLLRHM